MEDSTIRKTIADLDYAAGCIQRSVENIREICPHNSFSVLMFAWRPGALQPRRICDWCGGLVEGVTEDEKIYCWAEWNTSKEQPNEEVRKPSGRGAA